MFVVLGCTGDLCKKKVFPALNGLLREKLNKCTDSKYISEEVKLASGTLSSSSSFLQHSPLTQANPSNPRSKKEYIKAENSGGLSIKEMQQKDVLRNSGVYIPRIIGYARTEISTEELIRKIDPSINFLKELVSAIKYISGPYEECLERIEGQIEKYSPEIVYVYMAIPPTVYPCIIEQVKKSKHNIVLLAEKPFGTSLSSFKSLEKEVLPIKDKFLCIDHYLFKRVLLQVPQLLEVSPLNIITPECVKEVEGYFNEVDGVKERLGYFAEAGMCRDVLQNHLLVVVSSILGGRDRSSILSRIKEIQPKETILGEYKEYSEEIKQGGLEGKDPRETYIKTETEIEDPWGIPLKLECGKKMKKHFVGIHVNLSPEGVRRIAAIPVGRKDYENTKKLKRIPEDKISGSVEVSLTPKEYVRVSLYYKKSLLKRIAVPLFEDKVLLSPYEAMLNQVLYNNNTKDNFSSITEVEIQWKIVDKVLGASPRKKIVY